MCVHCTYRRRSINLLIFLRRDDQQTVMDYHIGTGPRIILTLFIKFSIKPLSDTLKKKGIVNILCMAIYLVYTHSPFDKLSRVSPCGGSDVDFMIQFYLPDFEKKEFLPLQNFFDHIIHDEQVPPFFFIQQ